MIDVPEFPKLREVYLCGLANELMTLPDYDGAGALARDRLENLEARIRCATALLELSKLTRSTVPIPYPFADAPWNRQHMKPGDNFDPFKESKR